MVGDVECGLTCIICSLCEVVVVDVELVAEAVRGVETPVEQSNVLDCWLPDGTRVAVRHTPAHG